MRNKILIGLAFLLFIGLALGCGYWLVQRQQFETDKAAFLDDYRATIREQIRVYYSMFGKLPESSDELLLAGTSRLRSPEVFGAMIRFEFNTPSLSTGWMATEAKTFAEVIPGCQEFIPAWQAQLEEARAPIKALDGDLSAQLDLLRDRNLATSVNFSYVIELLETRGLSEETIDAYLAACGRILQLGDERERVLSQDVSVDIEQAFAAKYEEQLQLAEQEYRDAKQAVLDKANADGG